MTYKKITLKLMLIYISSSSYGCSEEEGTVQIKKQNSSDGTSRGSGSINSNVEFSSLSDMERKTEGKYIDAYRSLENFSGCPKAGSVSVAKISSHKDPFGCSLIYFNKSNTYKKSDKLNWLNYSCYNLKKEDKVLCLIPTDCNIKYDSASGKYSSRLISLMEQNFGLSDWVNLRPRDANPKINLPLKVGEYAYSNFHDWNWTLQHTYWPDFENSTVEEIPELIDKIILDSLSYAEKNGFTFVLITHPMISDGLIDLGTTWGPKEDQVPEKNLFGYILVGEMVNAAKKFLDKNKTSKLKIILR